MHRSEISAGDKLYYLAANGDSVLVRVTVPYGTRAKVVLVGKHINLSRVFTAKMDRLYKVDPVVK